MADEIVIGKLIIDNSELNTAMAQSKKAIIALEEEQKKLKKETDGLTEANEEQLNSFIANENELKRLKAEYAANQRSVLELTRAQTGLDAALVKSVKTEKDAIANNKALKEARQQLDASTVEGAKAIEEINAKMNENNAIIDANKNKQEQAATITGNYRQFMFGLGESFDQARTIVTGFTGAVSDASDLVTKATASVGQATRATLGFRTSSQLAAESQVAQTATTETQVVANEALVVSQEATTAATTGTTVAMKALKIAIIATGIGAIVIAAVALYGALNNNETASNKFSKALAGLKGIFSGIMKILQPLGEFLVDVFVKNLERAGQVAEKVAGVISSALSFVGLDKAAKSLDNFTNSVKKSVINSQKLADAEARYAEAQRLSTKIQLDYQKAAEKLRQIRDDDSKSIASRIKANEDLGKTLAKQQASELSIANQALAIANLRIKLDGKSTENLNARAEALTGVSDIQERISGQESEQLANLNSLRKEAADKQKAITDKATEERLKNIKNEIDVLKLEEAQSNLTTEQRIANAEKIFALENKLAEQSLKGSDLQKQQIANRQNLSSAILAITDEQIQKQIDSQKKAFESTKGLSKEQFDSEVQSAKDLALAQTLLLDKKLLSEKAYADEVVKINTLKNESIAIAQTAFDEADKIRTEKLLADTRALEEVQHQIRLQDIAGQTISEGLIKQEILAENYKQEKTLLEQNLADNKISNDVYLASIALAQKKFNSDTKKNDDILKAQRKANNIQMANDGVQALTDLFGESKALSVASALINTYQGITAGLKLGYPAAIPAVAFAAATGFAAVKNILKTDKGSTSVDSGGGARAVSTTGAGAFANTAQTETIARATERPVDQNTIVTPPVLILETLHEKQDQLAIKIQS